MPLEYLSWSRGQYMTLTRCVKPNTRQFVLDTQKAADTASPSQLQGQPV